MDEAIVVTGNEKPGGMMNMAFIQHFGSFAKSDKKVFDFLYQAYYHQTLELARRLTNNRATAEDIVQEAFEKAYKNFDKIKDLEHFGRWLSVTASNLARDDLKKRNKHLLVGEVFEKNYADNYLDYNPEPKYLKSEGKEDMLAVVNSLKPIYKLVIIQKYFCDMSYNEIAENLQVSEGVLRTRCSRALNQLKERMEREEKKGAR